MFPEIVLFGKNFQLYSTLNNLGNICMFIWLIANIKEFNSFSMFPNYAKSKIGNKRGSALAGWCCAFVELLVLFAIMLIIAKPIANKISLIFLKAQSDNYFYNIFALPLLLIFFAILLRMSPLKFTDFVAPANALVLIFYKIACYCCGCCFGVESEKFGIYNPSNERSEVPVQLIEAGCALIMFIIILIVRRKKNRKQGILFPLFMLMYCASRFVSEFWRDDFPTVFGPLKGYHIQCIVGFVEGLILLFVALKFGDKISAFYSSKKERMIERASEKSSEENNSEE